jgi:hypothetical protein
MTAAFDGRLMRLQIALADTGETFVYDQNYYISSSGVKYTTANFADFSVRIDNIKKPTRDLLINRTSLWAKNRTVANISLEVGRASYGTFQIAAAQCIASGVTQPPDIGLVFTSLSQVGAMGIVGAYTAAPITTLKVIAQQVAQSNNLTLDYQAKQNPTIGNYHFTGPAAVQIKKLTALADIDVYTDDTNRSLIVTDSGVARAVPIVQVNATTGMVGVPQLIEYGIRCKQLIRNEVKVGAPVKVQSAINPGANGTFTLTKLAFDASSWETPFYWTMDLRFQQAGAQT